MTAAVTLPMKTLSPRAYALLGMMQKATEYIEDRQDRSLVQSLRRGEEAAIEQLYGRYAGSVLSYLVSRVGERPAAEDVLQQVFAELWQRSTDYDPERSGLFTWVMLVARSRATDHLRRRLPEPHEPAHAADMADSQVDAEPFDEMIERWRMAELLRRVPAGEARMLRMRFYEGLSQREIAERTSTPLGTVKMRMIQALERMRTLIQEEGV